MPRRRWPPLADRTSLRFTRAPIVPVALAFLAGALSGCSKSSDRSPSISLEHDIRPQPVRVGPATVTVRLADLASKPITGAQISIEGDMSHPGMSPVFGVAQESQAGRYQGQINFAMAGDWILLFHIALSDGRKLDRQVNVPAVRAN